MKILSRAVISLAVICSLSAATMTIPVSAATSAPAAQSSGGSSTTPQSEICKGSGGEWDGKQCTNKNASTTDVAGFVKSIINVLLYVLGAIAVLMIVIGGIRYTTSGGDQSGVKGAKDTILYAVVGLVVAMMAYAIVNFVVLNVK
ncbi:MAG: pilin [Candidatus Saccharimonadales bacterium]